MCRVGCVCYEKIPTSLRATNVCINCTSSPRFAPSFMQLRYDNKCTQTLWNTPKHEFRVQLDEPPLPPPSGSRGSAPPWPPRTPKEGARAGSTLRGHRRERDLFQGLPGNFPLILPFQPTLHWLSCSNETMQNAPKHYEMHQIMSLGSNGVDRVRSLRKNSDATS